MHDRHSAARAAGALLLTLLSHQSAQAQAGGAPVPPAAAPQGAWFDMPQRPGARVEVLTIDGNWHKARLRLVTSEGIFFEGDRPPIRREQVWQVYAGGKPSWGWRGFWIGLASGLALGAAIRADQGDCSDPTSVCAREGDFGWGAVAGVGLVVGGIGAIAGRLAKGPGRDAALVYAGPTVVKSPAGAPDRQQLRPAGPSTAAELGKESPLRSP